MSERERRLRSRLAVNRVARPMIRGTSSGLEPRSNIRAGQNAGATSKSGSGRFGHTGRQRDPTIPTRSPSAKPRLTAVPTPTPGPRVRVDQEDVSRVRELEDPVSRGRDAGRFCVRDVAHTGDGLSDCTDGASAGHVDDDRRPFERLRENRLERLPHDGGVVVTGGDADSDVSEEGSPLAHRRCAVARERNL